MSYECPFTLCQVCQKKTYCCELDTCKIAEHSGGAQLTRGGWVCSEQCWEDAAGKVS